MVGCGYEYDLVLSICHRVPDVQTHTTKNNLITAYSKMQMCWAADVRMCKMRTNSADIIWKCDGKVQRYVCGKSILLCLLLYSSKHTAIQLYPMTQSTICLWQLSSLCFNAQSSSSKDIVVVVTIAIKGRSRRWRCRHRQRRRKIAHAVTWWSTSQ